MPQLGVYFVSYWHCLHSVWSRVSETICLSIVPSMGPQQQTCSPAGRRYHAAGECGQ